MRRSLGVLAFSAALAASAAAVLAGEEPKRVALKTLDRWEVLEVFTVTESAVQETDMTGTDPNGKPIARRDERRRDAVVIWRCLEVNAEGRPLRALAFVQSWKQTTRGHADESLTGALFEVTPDKATSRLPAGKWSDDAKKWIQKNVHLRSDPDGGPTGGVEVPEPLAVGETCKIPLASMGALMGGGDGPPPEQFAKVESSFRVDVADETPAGTSVRCTIAFEGPLAGEIQSSKEATKVPVGDGSTLRAAGKSSALLGRSHRQSTLSVEGETTLLTEMSGAKVKAVGKFRMEKSRRPGGEMPNPPLPPPPTAEPKPEAPPAPPPPK